MNKSPLDLIMRKMTSLILVLMMLVMKRVIWSEERIFFV
jgi:hypothetical protein